MSRGLGSERAAPVDTAVHQETPEGVELTFTPAGPVPRALAWSIDLAVRGVAYVVAALVGQMLGGLGSGLALIAAFLFEWFYPVVFEVRSGRTPGKRALGLRVIEQDGAPVTLGASLLRNLVRFVDFMPAGYLFGLISCVASTRFQRLGDLAAGTLVVYTERGSVRALPEVSPRPPLVALTLDEQRAIVAFAERAAGWSQERRAELAAHTGACTRGSADERAAELASYARWIAGDR